MAVGMENTTRTVAEVRGTIETIKTLGFKEGSIDLEVQNLLGAVDMNLARAINEKSLQAILLAIYCLGKVNDRFLHLAGDIPGYRCRRKEFRSEYRSYAECARELAQKLTTLVVEANIRF